VMGNMAGDLDSVVGSILLSVYLTMNGGFEESKDTDKGEVISMTFSVYSMS